MLGYSKLIAELRKITLSRNDEKFVDEAAYYHAFAQEMHKFFQDSVDGYLFSFPFVSEKGKERNPSNDWLVSAKLRPRSLQKKIREHLIKGGEILKDSDEAFSLSKLMIENLIDAEIQSILLKSRSDKLEPIEENLTLAGYLTEFIVIDLRKCFKNELGEFTEYFMEKALELRVQPSNFGQLYERLLQFIEVPGPDHFFYLIKPTANHKQFNVVLALGVTVPLDADDFHLIRLLIYRFVSEVAIRKLEEMEVLKRKTSFSLTTHAFKTEISGTLIPQVEIIKELAKPDEDSELAVELEVLHGQCRDFFDLTGLISLIDKIKKKDDFVTSGTKDNLLVGVRQSKRVKDFTTNYNEKHIGLQDVVIVGDVNAILNINIYDQFLAEPVIRLFYNMIFENLNINAKRHQGKIILEVNQNRQKIVFENDMKVDEFEIKEDELRGNLLLFKTLIEETHSGNMVIEARNRKFKIALEMKDE